MPDKLTNPVTGWMRLYGFGSLSLTPIPPPGSLSRKGNRVHEVLNRRRGLTLKMIWRLHEGLGIPAESLIKKRAA